MFRRITALHADGQRLGDLVGHREQLRHGMERASQVIRVESGDQDALADIGQAHDGVDQAFAQELRFVDADHFHAPVEPGFQFGGVPDRVGADLQLAVRDDVVFRVALVDAGLEDLHPLARNLGAAQAADQLLALAAEHRPADDFNPAQTSLGKIHD